MQNYTITKYLIWTRRKLMVIGTLALVNSVVFAPVAQAATLKLGSSGANVLTLQSELAHLGYSIGTLDGIYGPKTLAAVDAFQGNDHLKVDGIAGLLTQNALEKMQTPSVPSSSSTEISGIVSETKRLLGTAYLWGGTTPAGFDCSGFTQYVFASQGIELPRISRDQAKIGTAVPYNNLQPGDLVFFSFTGNGTISHVGIYLGNSQFISATTHKGVTIYSFTSYWLNAYIGAQRVL
ncbi:Cell wall-associated hydrolase, invasion-associated protein [Candidatus Desulfosporosinus infrequens]|uniref:Cell wall-associated hydrolase, invasion-associated protein n=1 Tax=Candidatus Desulfosporosinus infrequens TaxID=2043169 RepID=A0A2U3LKQ0_9FIRM|nr:Cell wall-associated hydrolase, invasion-associated protein [Candidatus Desulfosporosinus infrequens]